MNYFNAFQTHLKVTGLQAVGTVFFPSTMEKNTAGSWECCQVVPGFLLFCYELSTWSLQCIPLTSWEAKDGLFCLTHPSPIYLQHDFLKN